MSLAPWGRGAPGGSRPSRRAAVRAAILALGAGLVSACTGGGDASRNGSSAPASTASPASTGAPGETTTSPIPSAPPSSPLPKAKGSGGFTVLVIGSDSRTTSLAGRSDVITVVQLSADQERVNLVSIARDTLATMPTGNRTKINAAYALGGIDGISHAVSALLGDLPIDATLEVSFPGFKQLIAAFGGLTVANRIASEVGNRSFPSGAVTLNPNTALVYARQRKGLVNGDLDRTERHRTILTGMLTTLAERARANPTLLAALVPVLMAPVRATGLTPSQAVGLIPVVARLGPQSVSSVLVPIRAFGMVGGASVDLVNETRTRQLGEALAAGDLTAYIAKYGTSNAVTG